MKNIYQMKVSFDTKNWYQIQWTDIDINDFDHIKGIDNVTTIDGLENLVKTEYPNTEFTWKYIGERKK
jgi:hypothetical protein